MKKMITMLFNSLTYIIEHVSARKLLIIILFFISLFVFNSFNILPIAITTTTSLIINIFLMLVVFISFLIFIGNIMFRAEINDQKRSNID